MRMDHNSMIAVLTAHQDGKAIQAWNHCHEKWFDIAPGDTGFNFTDREYRIKPEPPKPREWWICYDNDPAEKATMVYSVQQNIIGCGRKQVHVREVLPDEEGKA